MTQTTDTAYTYEPYTCGDDDCNERRDNAKRCPWCWGGFPIAAGQTDPYNLRASLDDPFVGLD